MSDDLQPPTVDRRRFLTVLGTAAGGGAMALSGCSTDRVQKLVPYLVQSENQVPGVATWAGATALTVIPCSPSSRAITRVMPISAPLLAT